MAVGKNCHEFSLLSNEFYLYKSVISFVSFQPGGLISFIILSRFGYQRLTLYIASGLSVSV